MHTPGHAVVNLAVLGASTPPELAAPILLGAALPDVPIVVLYAKERLLHHTPEEEIWSDHYQRRFWQNLIHGTHSIPGALAGLALSLVFGQSWLGAFFGSALLHAMLDLPVHNEDAHRHFLPFSSYRFISPLSYWDPRHYGQYVAAAEILLVGAGCSILILRYREAWVALLLGLVMAWYFVNYGRSFVRRSIGSHPSRPG